MLVEMIEDTIVQGHGIKQAPARKEWSTSAEMKDPDHLIIVVSSYP